LGVVGLEEVDLRNGCERVVDEQTLKLQEVLGVLA
jgi:hypothetical protein